MFIIEMEVMNTVHWDVWFQRVVSNDCCLYLETWWCAAQGLEVSDSTSYEGRLAIGDHVPTAHCGGTWRRGGWRGVSKWKFVPLWMFAPNWKKFSWGVRMILCSWEHGMDGGATQEHKLWAHRKKNEWLHSEATQVPTLVPRVCVFNDVPLDARHQNV